MKDTWIQNPLRAFPTLILMSLDHFRQICNWVIVCPPYLEQLSLIQIHACLIHSSLFSEPVFPLRAPVPELLSNEWGMTKSKPRLKLCSTLGMMNNHFTHN